MKTKVWKKNAVLATVILFVCVAVYLNWHYGRQVAEDVSGAGVQSTDDSERIAAAPAPQLSSLKEKETNSPDASASPNGDEGQSAEQTPSDTPSSSDVTLDSQADGGSGGYFASARLNREQARDESVEILRETASSEDASQEVKDAAFTEMSKIADNTIVESQIEGLVMAKGFSDCVAYISDDGVSVIVSSPESGLDSQHVTQIKDIVISETGVAAAAITVIEVEG